MIKYRYLLVILCIPFNPIFAQKNEVPVLEREVTVNINNAPLQEALNDIINDESSWDGSGRSDLRFGQDQNENIYISSKRNGWVYKIQSITPPLAPPDVIALHKLSEGDFASVYPNPLTVSGRMIVAFNTPLEQSAKVRFVGADGSIIWASDIPAGLTQYTLDLAVHNLQPGYYLIKINSGNNSEVKPVALY